MVDFCLLDGWYKKTESPVVVTVALSLLQSLSIIRPAASKFGCLKRKESQEGATLPESGYSLTEFKLGVGEAISSNVNFTYEKNLNNCFYKYIIDYANRNK